MRQRNRRMALYTGIVLLAASVLAACTVSIAGGIAGIIASGVLVAFVALLGGSQSGCELGGACLSVVYDPGDQGSDAPDPLSQSDVGPCLSIDIIPLDADPDAGPCLSPQLDAGPCLSVILPDAGPCLQPPYDVIEEAYDDTDIGPCLEWIPDADVGPCLSDIGPCLSPPYDAGAEAEITPCLDWVPDAGPCLSPPFDGGSADFGPCLSIQPPLDVIDDAAGDDGDAGDAADVPVKEYFGPCLSPPIDSRVDPRLRPDAPEVARAESRAVVLDRIAAREGLPADVLERLHRRGRKG